MGESNDERYIVALEIGSSKVRGAVGVVDSIGVVDVIAVEEESMIDKVRYGCIQNVEVANPIIAVIERLQSYPRISPRKITGVYVALGGRSLVSKTADVSISLPSEVEITRPVINDLCQQAAATVSSDRDTVEVVPVRFTVDNKVQPRPEGSYGRNIAGKMTVLSCAPQLKRMLRRVVTERLNLNINGYVTRVLAEADITLSDDERRLGCMFVDFGAETTTAAIYKNGAPVYVATLPIGSRNITFDLTALNQIEERAEKIKKSSGNALAQEGGQHKDSADGIDYSEVNNYVHSRADEIVANIRAQIEYAGMRDSDLPSGIVIVGGGARLRGFNELLSQQTNLKVRQGAPAASVRLTDGSADRMVDVISVLVAASKMPNAECLTPQVKPETDESARPDSYETRYNSGNIDDIDEGASRIGQIDDTAGTDDGEFKSDAENEPKKTKGSFFGFGRYVSKIKQRLADTMDDTTEFRD